jgi:hypothetical protein
MKGMSAVLLADFSAWNVVWILFMAFFFDADYADFADLR